MKVQFLEQIVCKYMNMRDVFTSLMKFFFKETSFFIQTKIPQDLNIWLLFSVKPRS